MSSTFSGIQAGSVDKSRLISSTPRLTTRRFHVLKFLNFFHGARAFHLKIPKVATHESGQQGMAPNPGGGRAA